MPAQAEDVRNGCKAKLSNESGLWETARRWWQKSYAGDYLGLVLIAIANLFVKMLEEPFHQMFVINDFRINHPWAEFERVDLCGYSILQGGLVCVVVLLM